jgi:hypothetical protein
MGVGKGERAAGTGVEEEFAIGFELGMVLESGTSLLTTHFEDSVYGSGTGTPCLGRSAKARGINRTSAIPRTHTKLRQDAEAFLKAMRTMQVKSETTKTLSCRRNKSWISKWIIDCLSARAV